MHRPTVSRPPLINRPQASVFDASGLLIMEVITDGNVAARYVD